MATTTSSRHTHRLGSIWVSPETKLALDRLSVETGKSINELDWCQNGHDKGLYYDPNSDETDSWGYPEPCDPGTKNAIKWAL